MSLVLLCLCFMAPAWAQQPSSAATTFSGPKRHMATIIFSGLGGAVLGLSTLSFYGRPQDHLSNIAIGFGVGVITGTVVMTYRAATNPREFYAGPPVLLPTLEEEQARLQQVASTKSTPLGSWKLTF